MRNNILRSLGYVSALLTGSFVSGAEIPVNVFPKPGLEDEIRKVDIPVAVLRVQREGEVRRVYSFNPGMYGLVSEGFDAEKYVLGNDCHENFGTISPKDDDGKRQRFSLTEVSKIPKKNTLKVLRPRWAHIPNSNRDHDTIAKSGVDLIADTRNGIYQLVPGCYLVSREGKDIEGEKKMGYVDTSQSQRFILTTKEVIGSLLKLE
jgi:hypothetical protein